MLFRIVAAGFCIFLVMLAVKDGRVLRTSGLTGSCTVVGTYTDSSELTTCLPGKLEGAPDLSHRGCQAVGFSGKVEQWRCPAGFDISDLRR
ncbi:MAG TPA: hypothetical protein VFA30_00335 [Gaiellaceae bacterium]|nr:hypothetical protein [Gaiellaceae bacterium]